MSTYQTMSAYYLILACNENKGRTFLSSCQVNFHFVRKKVLFEEVGCWRLRWEATECLEYENRRNKRKIDCKLFYQLPCQQFDLKTRFSYTTVAIAQSEKSPRAHCSVFSRK